jgi:hypothetical protein
VLALPDSGQSDTEQLGKLNSFVQNSLPWFGVAADFLAILTSLLNLWSVDGRPGAFIGFGLVGVLLALIYLVRIWPKKNRLGRKRVQVCAAFLAVILGVALVVVGFFFEDLAKEFGPSDVSVNVGGARILKPVAGDKAGRCVRVEGVGTPRPGYVYRIAAAPDADRIWVTRETKPPKGAGVGYEYYAWALYLGGVEDFSPEYDIRVYEVPEAKLEKYDKRAEKDKPHTAKELAEDGLIMVHSIRVKRSTAEEKSCLSTDEGVTIPS